MCVCASCVTWGRFLTKQVFLIQTANPQILIKNFTYACALLDQKKKMPRQMTSGNKQTRGKAYF